jgi:sulfur-oxidizing protein SoxX
MLSALLAGSAAADGLVAYRVEGDGIPAPLTGAPGEPARGRAIVANRQIGTCLLCHSAPIPEERFQGTIGPDLRGVGARLGEAELRLRVVDPARSNKDTVMPSYYTLDGLTRVGKPWRGKPVLSAEQVEDVVAYLATLKEQ